MNTKLYLFLMAGMLMILIPDTTSAQTAFSLKFNAGEKIEYYEAYGRSSVSSYTTVGLGAVLHLTLSEKLGLQPELNYLIPVSEPFSFHMISLPVMFTYKAFDDLVVEVGPSVERDISSSGNHGYGRSYDKSFKPDYNLGTNLGVKILLTDKWSAGFRYTYEVFRTKYTYTYSYVDSSDPLLLQHIKREADFRDTALTASISYKLK